MIGHRTLFMTIGWGKYFLTWPGRKNPRINAFNSESFGGGGIFFISFAYWAIFTAVADYFWKQPEFQLVGGLLYTIGVCMTPLAVYGLQKVRSYSSKYKEGVYYVA